MSSTTISRIGNFPFCIRETAQDGLPVEIWDGSTYFDTLDCCPQFLPSKTEEGVPRDSDFPDGERTAITVVGPGTMFPIGLTLEELMFLYWRVKRWGVKPTDGDMWRNQGPGNGTPLDIYPIIEQGLEIEYTKGLFYNTDEGSLNCASGSWSAGIGDFLEEVEDSAPPTPLYSIPGIATIALDLTIVFNFNLDFRSIFGYYNYLYYNGINTYPVPVFRSGDLYYPLISVDAAFRSLDSTYYFTENIGTEPPTPGFITVYPRGSFTMFVFPFKVEETDLGISAGFPFGTQPSLTENVFNLVIKFPTRDVTIPFYGFYESCEWLDENQGYQCESEYLVSSLPMVYTAEPSKYFSYGGTYDEDTGEPLASP